MIYLKRHLHCLHVRGQMMAQGLGLARSCAWETQSEVGDKADPPHASLAVTHTSFYHLLQESDSPYTYLYTCTITTLIFSFPGQVFLF